MYVQTLFVIYFSSITYITVSIYSPPTFSAPTSQFIGIMAGGDVAIRTAVEGAEDSETLPVEDLSAISPPLDPYLDTVIGIASSGRTPYVLAGLKHAKVLGCLSVGIACVSPSAMRGCCDYLVECTTGSEVVTGSTRMKAGTATKLVSHSVLSPCISQTRSRMLMYLMRS